MGPDLIKIALVFMRPSHFSFYRTIWPVTTKMAYVEEKFCLAYCVFITVK